MNRTSGLHGSKRSIEAMKRSQENQWIESINWIHESDQEGTIDSYAQSLILVSLIVVTHKNFQNFAEDLGTSHIKTSTNPKNA